MITAYYTGQESDNMDYDFLSQMLYLFSSSNKEQRQNKQNLPVKYNKNGRLIGPLTHDSGTNIERNSYGRKINTAELCNQPDQAK